MTEREEREKITAEVQSQLDDICDYICSRGDTMHKRDEVRTRARSYLHGLNAKGWKIVRRDSHDH